MSSATNFGVTLTSDRLHPRNLFIIFLCYYWPSPISQVDLVKRSAMQCWDGNCHISQMSALCNWTSVFHHMVIGRPNYSKSSCCNIILHCDASTTSATANLSRCIKMTLHPTALKPEHKRSSKQLLTS